MVDICFLNEEFLGCGRKICGAICFCLFLGPALIIIAIAMFVVAAKDPRDHHISEYNVAVDAWVDSNYAQFHNLSLAFEVQDDDEEWNLMKNLTSPDPINDSGKSIHRYSEYIRYSYYGYILQTPTSTSSDSVSVENVATGESMTVGVTSYIDDWYTPSELGCTHSCSSTTYSSGNCYSPATCQSYCFNRNGYWDPFWDQCYVVKYAKEVCIKVQDDGSFNHNDQMCYGEVYGDWEPDEVGANGGVRDIPQITVIVRVASDPYILLYKLTGGSLSFGLTSAQYAEIGIVFIVVGGFVMAMITGLFILACALGHCLFCTDRQRF